MRAGPLSNSKVISLLNRFFVPVYAMNEDYRDGGAAPAADRAEYNRIFKQSLAAGLSTGTVHVYILSSPQSAPPRGEADSLVLHLTSRSLDGRGAWSDFPVEDWIVLSRSEWEKFLPANPSRIGHGWVVDKKTSEKLLTRFYPPTENNDVTKNHFERQTLKANLVQFENGGARVRIEGDLRMRHSFYHKEDGKVVEATFIGFIDFDPASRSIRSFQLVTDRATYGGGTFGVAVRSM